MKSLKRERSIARAASAAAAQGARDGKAGAALKRHLAMGPYGKGYMSAYERAAKPRWVEDISIYEEAKARVTELESQMDQLQRNFSDYLGAGSLPLGGDFFTTKELDELGSLLGGKGNGKAD